ncbi:MULTISPECIES: hypothetical protein [unclassified Marinitoga]|uniref:hypothetical protein n=1 Tax=unclassified Marinitoga TaxID=2640159 RepID=UPI0006415D7C|nr:MULTISPECIES: hypothetical protein [unclassified Marinitoga]KLO20889.1 hypothetical protein X274_11665 [Marinitoga sp. 1155]NUU99217.1 hypothetical protein [Marinitoga sp. 1154]
MKKFYFLSFFIIISILTFSLNIGIYSNGIFIEFPIEKIKIKAGFPTFGLSYSNNNDYIKYNLVADFNLNNPQLNNYISSDIGITFGNITIYSGFWNVFNDLNSIKEATSTVNIGDAGFSTGFSTEIENLKLNIFLNLKALNWIKTGTVVTNLPAFSGTFEDSVLFTIGIDYSYLIDNNKINIFFNFGTNYISFPNGLTLYQFKNNYNFGILLTINDLLK